MLRSRQIAASCRGRRRRRARGTAARARRTRRRSGAGSRSRRGCRWCACCPRRSAARSSELWVGFGTRCRLTAVIVEPQATPIDHGSSRRIGRESVQPTGRRARAVRPRSRGRAPGRRARRRAKRSRISLLDAARQRRAASGSDVDEAARPGVAEQARDRRARGVQLARDGLHREVLHVVQVGGRRASRVFPAPLGPALDGVIDSSCIVHPVSLARMCMPLESSCRRVTMYASTRGVHRQARPHSERTEIVRADDSTQRSPRAPATHRRAASRARRPVRRCAHHRRRHQRPRDLPRPRDAGRRRRARRARRLRQRRSAASSHMIHGGIRYLENGEFRLVHESVTERNALLRIAPHYVRPLQTTIPIFSTFSGVLTRAAALPPPRPGKPHRARRARSSRSAWSSTTPSRAAAAACRATTSTARSSRSPSCRR